MGLTPEQIASIYKRKEEKAAAPKRGGGGRKKAVDFTDRSYQAWFAIEHTDPGEAWCSNPECNDPRGKHRASPPESAEQVVAEVSVQYDSVVADPSMVGGVTTVLMCRYCFTFNWLAPRAV